MARGMADSDDSDFAVKPQRGRPRKKETKAKKVVVADAKKRRRKDERDDERDDAPPKAAANKKTKLLLAKEPAPPPVVETDDPLDPALLEEKYRALKNARETDAERLLRQARELALAEQKTHEALVSRLRKEITALSSRLEEEKQSKKKAKPAVHSGAEGFDPEAQARYDTLQRKHKDVLSENETLRVRIRELETHFAQYKRSTGPDDKVIVNSAASSAENAWKASEATMQLAQANKLLEIYRLVTSTDIRLIEAADDDDDNSDSYTDIACTTTDGESGKRFNFELAVPDSRMSEIEYLPSEQPPEDVNVPSYLQDELSFKRSEMTKFMRTVLDVVIRKKTDAGQSKR